MAGSRVLAALLIVVLSALAADAQAAWYDSNWQYRKALTIDSAQVPSDQTNFAVLISITDTDLAAGARSDGFDIVFTDSAGTTKLDHEIESYASGTGALVAWVRVPTLTSSANNIVYLYYGYASATDQQNTPGVWDANYVGVWHLDESPANGVAGHDESTGNPTDATPLNFGAAAGSRTNGVGQIDGADELDGVDDRVDAGSDAVLDDLGPLTISAWVKPDTYLASNAPTVVRKDSGGAGNGRWLVEIDNTAPESNSLAFLKGHTTSNLDVASATGVIVIGAWQQVVATWDGSVNVSGVHLYVNGLETAYGATQAGVGTPISDAIENVVFGASGDGTSALHGSIDEVHISNTVRSADWIRTEYNNQNSPGVGGFLASISSEETESGGSSCGAGQTVYSTATSETYTVPAGCDTLQVKAWGAGGGGGTSGQTSAGGAGGGGGYAEGIITVTPSEGLAIVLGGGGPGGINPAAGDGGGGNAVTAAGGGTGGNEGDTKGGGAGGGGGYAAVKRGTTFLIQAGGGGGGGGGGELSGAGGAGGAGGGVSGIAGSSGGGAGGGPGTSSSGGSAGTGGTSGSADSGGNGANGGGGGGGSSLVTGTSTQEIAGAGTAAGNNGDADYGGTASIGGAAGGANGNPGRIVLIPSGSGGPATQGFNDPTADAARAGTAAITPANAYTADDIYGELKDTTQHDYLTYGFCIAPGATIQGVEVRTDWHTTKATDTGFLTLQLIDSAGLLVGTSKTTPTIGGTTDVTHTMGGPADTWGASLTDVIVNDGNFGVSLLYTKTAGGGENKAFVDNVDIQVFYTGGSGGCEWYDSNWLYRKKITIDSSQVTADQTDFPVLISFTDAQVGANSRADGFDLLFTDTDGITKLDYEIETYTTPAGTLVAWVRIPLLTSATDKVIYLYYGNSGASDQQNPPGVWNANYVGVWHLKEDPSAGAPQVKDSTSNAKHGTSAGAMTPADQTAGVINGSLDFDINDNVNMGNQPEHDLSIYSWSMWLKGNAAPVSPAPGSNEQPLVNDTQFQFNWSHFTASSMQSAGHRDSVGWKFAQIASPLSGNTWYHIVGTYDGSNLKVYLNGALEDTQAAGTPVLSAAAFSIGDDAGSTAFVGQMDEVRISDIARSASWTQTSYNNQSSPGGFLKSIGSEETGQPVAHWTFDEGSGQTAADSSGNSRDATLGSTGSADSSDPAWMTCAVGGSALDFDGVDDYVEDPDGELYINGLTEFTASAWIKSDVTGTDRGFLHTMVPDNSDSVLGIRYDAAGSQGGGTNVIKVGISVNGTNQLLESSNNIQTTNWQHVVVTWSSGNQLALYLDGSLDTPLYNEAGVTGSLTNATTLFIGKAGKDDVNGGWDGQIDQVRLYDRVLSAAEISALAATAPSGCAVGPVAHWDFDEGSGQTAADSSGFANDGQLGSTTGVDANDPSWLCVSGGYALDFNGTSDYVDLGSPASLNLTTTFTVAAWVKWKGGNLDAVIYASGNANADHYRVDVNNCNANGLSLREDGDACHSATSNLLPADAWHHVAVSKDGDTGTNLTFYLDGVSDGTASAGTSGATGLKRIGARTELTDQFFDGAIDDLRIYDRALSGAEIGALAATAPSDCAAGTLFRSVGTDATDLNVATRTVEITGTTATFSGPMPDKVGVGDVLQYQVASTWYAAFISGRTSTTVYTLKSATGGTPQAAPALTAVNVYRAYTSQYKWETQDENDNLNDAVENFDTSKDLVSADTVMHVAAYADGPDTDGNEVYIDGWTTGAENYIRIYTPVAASEVGVSQRHTGTAGSGYVKRPTQAISGSYYQILTIKTNYVRIDGLEIDGSMLTGAETLYGLVISVTSGSTDIRIENSLIHDLTNTNTTPASARYVRGILSLNGYSQNLVKIANTIVYSITNLNTNSSSSSHGISIKEDQGSSYLYNNTVFDIASPANSSTAHGIRLGTAVATHYLKNNYVGQLTCDTCTLYTYGVQAGRWYDHQHGQQCQLRRFGRRFDRREQRHQPGQLFELLRQRDRGHRGFPPPIGFERPLGRLWCGRR